MIKHCIQQITFNFLKAQRTIHNGTINNTKQIPTIFALSSGKGKSGIAVIRVSGPSAKQAILKLTSKDLPPPHSVKLKKFFDPVTNELLDKGFLIWFPGPKSFTGEDCCEFHIHGGTAVIAAMLKSLSKLPEFQFAEPGEFTKRAFFNGKLDLTQVEGLADIIAAETEAQRKQAIHQMEGSLNKMYKQWTNSILKCLAHVEAFIDFGEDEIIEDEVLYKVLEDVQNLVQEIQKLLNDNKRGERIRNGVSVTIVGEPNVGKSSLLNILCQRQVAITSPIAGTTRDIIECAYDFNGYAVMFSDTAGLCHTNDLIEKEGVKRARQKAKQADLLILMMNATILNSLELSSNKYLLDKIIIEYGTKLGILNECDYSDNDNTRSSRKNESNSENFYSIQKIVVINKVDLLKAEVIQWLSHQKSHYFNWIPVSCKSQSNIENFKSILIQEVEKLCSDSPDCATITRLRHRIHLKNCISNLKEFLQMFGTNSDLALAAENLRKAMFEIGKITGKVSTEQILDVIFKEFCIGK